MRRFKLAIKQMNPWDSRYAEIEFSLSDEMEKLAEPELRKMLHDQVDKLWDEVNLVK